MKTYRVTASGSVAADDAEVFENVVHGAPITRTLPASMLSQGPSGTRPVGRVVHIADVDGNASAYPITVAPGGAAQTINGAATYTIDEPFQTVTLRRDADGSWSLADGIGPRPTPPSSTKRAGSDVSRSYQSRLDSDEVYVSDFMTDAQLAEGIAKTKATNMAPAIQEAVNWAIHRGNSGGRGLARVILPAGDFRIDDSIHAGYGTSFTTVIIQGQGAKVTTLTCSFNDRPAICVQGARETIISHMSLEGQNTAHVVELTTRTDLSVLDAANWVDPDFPAASSSRFAPHAGVAVDPRAGTRPETSYPDVTYPAYLGAVAQYGKNFSSRVRIEDCLIQGFVVGVVVQPCDSDGNGDYVQVNHCEIARCQYGMSVGNTQARLSSCTNSVLQRVHTGFVTMKHGKQLGKPSLYVSNTEIRVAIKWIDCPNTGYGGGPKFDYCYGEGVYSVGNVGSSGSDQYSVQFNHCEFNAGTPWGVPVYMLRNDGSGFVTLDSCTATNGGEPGHFACFGLRKAKTFIIRGMQLDTDAAVDLYEAFAWNATLGLHFNQCATDIGEYSCRSGKQRDLNTGETVTAPVYTGLNSGNRDVCLPVYSSTVRANINDPGFGLPHPEYTLGKSGKSFTIDGRDVTVDLGAGYTQALFTQQGGDVGDVVWDSETGVTFYVRSRTGTTITMRAKTGFGPDEELLTPVTDAGSLYFLNCRKYTPPYVTYCATTAGSAVATSVQRDDGFKAYIATEMPAGDTLWVDPEVDHFIPTTGAAISAVDATAGTLTASGNFRRTDPRHRLKLFVRAPAPNA